MLISTVIIVEITNWIVMALASGLDRQRAGEINEFAVAGLQTNAVFTRGRVRVDGDFETDDRVRRVELLFGHGGLVHRNERRANGNPAGGNLVETLASYIDGERAARCHRQDGRRQLAS